MSPAARDLIARLLERKPAKRLGMLQGRAVDIKQHKWFEGFDWQALAARRLEPPRVPKETDHAKRKAELAEQHRADPVVPVMTAEEMRECEQVFKDF
jgi:cGMP-dependent protein kinase 2